jgi:uncharacterized membrane protein
MMLLQHRHHGIIKGDMPTPSSPPTLKELQKSEKPLRNVNAEHRGSLSRLEKFAIAITEHVGTMGFFIVIFTWTIIWLTWNTLGPPGLQFDPFPAFVLWLFISNMIQLFLLPLLMIGQNLQERHAETRAQADFEVNKKSERLTEAILLHLEEQGRILGEIQDKLKNR